MDFIIWSEGIFGFYLCVCFFFFFFEGILFYSEKNDDRKNGWIKERTVHH